MGTRPGPPWAVLQHVDHEGPGLIATTAEQRGLSLEVVRADRGERLPDADRVGGLVVMGGPMAVYETDEHPYLLDEIDLVGAALDRGMPVLGVCLGAQILARAAGGSVFPGEVSEIGLGEVELTEEGRRDPVVGAAGSPAPVMHWHGDTFRPPDGVPSLARSALYPAQAFRPGERAWGLQFHVEVDRSLADGFAAHLPSGVRIDEEGRRRVEAAGARTVGAFFDAALGA